MCRERLLASAYTCMHCGGSPVGRLSENSKQQVDYTHTCATPAATTAVYRAIYTVRGMQQQQKKPFQLLSICANNEGGNYCIGTAVMRTYV